MRRIKLGKPSKYSDIAAPHFVGRVVGCTPGEGENRQRRILERHTETHDSGLRRVHDLGKIADAIATPTRGNKTNLARFWGLISLIRAGA